VSLREQMPETAAFIDALRREFGAELVDAAIRAGIKGQAGCFYAEERGHQVGTPFKRGLVVEALPGRPAEHSR
jgi:hypothetical protein